jgi:hypothetical protein
MASDGYTSFDSDFVAAMMYVFGDAALTQIVITGDNGIRRDKEFHLDIPSLDAEEYRREFDNGHFQITDLKHYLRTRVSLVRIMKEMDRRRDTEWVSPSWIAGRN